MSAESQTKERQAFLAWFARYWAGDDPDDPNPVPSTGDWQCYAAYERAMATAWAAWQARAALPWRSPCPSE